MTKDSTALHLSDIAFTYHDDTDHGSAWNLQVESIRFYHGEFTSIIGPNGSGKSTFLRIIAGIQSSSSGQITLEGQSLHTMERREIASIIGYLPQQTSHDFDLQISEIVAMGRYPHLGPGGFLSIHDLEVIDQVMEQTDTLRFKNRRFSQLSGGERQRVLLASVLAQEPSILLLDEPTTALDIHHQVRFFQMLSHLAHGGMSVGIVTHEINPASLFCDRMILMNHGKIVHDSPPSELLVPQIMTPIYGDEILLAQHPQRERMMLFPAIQEDAS